MSLNGNDANDFLQTCPPGDLACLQAGAPAAIAAYQTRLTAILRQLRAAAPDAEIIVVGAYDPNLGAFAFADPLFSQLNQAQQAAATAVRARFADPFPVFNPQGGPGGRDYSDLRAHPALQPRRRSPLRRRLPGAGRHRLGRIRLREPAVTMLAGQRRSGRDPLEADREASLAAGSATNWPPPIVVPASTSSSPHHKRASRPGPMAAITQ